MKYFQVQGILARPMNRLFFATTIALLALGAMSASAEDGTGVFYSNRLQGRRTASGKIFDQNKLTAAHKTLPFGTKVKITSVETQKSVVVTINDRMPASNPAVIDMTRRAARQIGIVKQGHAPVNVEVQP
jgi:rare lipoprotein A